MVCALQSGRANDPLIQSIMRELWWLASLSDIEITVRHKPGKKVIEADALSRLATITGTDSQYHRIVAAIDVPQFHVPHDMLAPPIPI